MRLVGSCSFEFKPVVYTPTMQCSQDTVKGQDVLIVEEVESFPDLKVRDYSIKTIINAGLLDKLALNKPIQLSMLQKQDIIFDSADFIEQLSLKADVEARQKQLDDALAALDAKRASQSQSTQSSQTQQTSQSADK